MRRFLLPLVFTAVACNTDSAVGTNGPGGTVVTDAKNMAVGEVRVLTPSQLPNGIELSTSSSATDYLIVVANTSPALDVQANYVVRGDQLIDPARLFVSAPSKVVAVEDNQPTAQEAADSHIRAFERAHLNPAHAISASVRARASLGISPVVATAVGQQVSIRVPSESSSDLCANFVTTTGTVKSISRRATIIIDNNADNAFTQADFDAIAAEFDNSTYPTDSAYFGVPTDMDANGHVVLYYTPEVNKLTNAGETSFVGGFFFAGDFFPRTGTNSCAESNGGEIFYLLAPDPTGRFNNVRSTASVRQLTRGTVAHEFQHMINAGNRIQSNASSFESVWLDEGLAHTAEDAVGRAEKGFSDTQALTDADLFPTGTTSGSSVSNDYNAFFFQNFRRFANWLSRPDTSSGLSKHTDENLSSRGAIWALIRWSGDQYSGGSFRSFTRKLAAGPDTGVKNLSVASGQPLDTLLAGWMVSNYSDHSGIAGLPARYNYVGYNMRSVISGSLGSSYPLQVTTLASGAVITSKALPGSGTYYRVTVPANATRTIKVEDPVGGPTTFVGAHYYVLRID